MAVVQIDGSTAVTRTSTDNNGGVIKGGGAISNTGLWTTSNLGLPASLAHFGGASVISGVGGTTGVLESAPFGINLGQGVTMRVTSTITDIANSVLAGAASDFAYNSGIVPVESRVTINYASGIRNGNWLEYSGMFNPALKTRTDSFGADHAARSSWGVPGEWIFMQGGKIPTSGEYSQKTG